MKVLTNIGKVLQTRSIYEESENNPEFLTEVQTAFKRYIKCDWGELCKEDKEMNDNAVNNGDDRILAAYETSKGKIYIITEWDRSATTILFANEY
ncbi:MAG: hypothetical protein ACI37T_03550 [Candidatus Gastranaerophilaceae bacterium]